MRSKSGTDAGYHNRYSWRVRLVWLCSLSIVAALGVLAFACGDDAPSAVTPAPEDGGDSGFVPETPLTCTIATRAQLGANDCLTSTSAPVVGGAKEGGSSDAAPPSPLDGGVEVEPAGPARCPVERAFDVTCKQGERGYGGLGFGIAESDVLVYLKDRTLHRLAADGADRSEPLPPTTEMSLIGEETAFAMKGGVAIAGNAIFDKGRASGFVVRRADGSFTRLADDEKTHTGRFASGPDGTGYGLLWAGDKPLFWRGEDLGLSGALQPSNVRAFAFGPAAQAPTLVQLDPNGGGTMIDDRRSPVAFGTSADGRRTFEAHLAVGAQGPVVAYAFRQILLGGYLPDGRPWTVVMTGRPIGCDPGSTTSCSGSCEGEGAFVPEDEVEVVADDKGRVWALWLEDTFVGSLIQAKGESDPLCQIFGGCNSGCNARMDAKSVLKTELVVARVKRDVPGLVERARVLVPKGSESKLRALSQRGSGQPPKLLRVERAGNRIAVAVSSDVDGANAVLFLDPEAMP